MSKKVENPVPLLALKELVVFPGQVVPLFVGREKSVRAIEEAQKEKKLIMLATQKDAMVSNPNAKDIYDIGTLGEVVQLIRLADGPIRVLVEGKSRARIDQYVQQDSFMLVNVSEVDIEKTVDTDIKALMRTLVSTFETYVKLGRKVNPEMIMQVSAIEDPCKLADSIVVQLNLKLEDRQTVLETFDPKERLEKVLKFMKSEIEIMQVERRIRGRVKKQMEKSQKEYYLNEQMRAIQKELGDKDDFKNEIQELEEKLAAKDMPDEAKTKTAKELRKLKMMSPMSAEASVVRNYIDWMIALPWNEVSEDSIDLDLAVDVLDEDHYGLEKVKERIVEYLAVQKLVGALKGPILCLVGPPGVGKTSLGKSIARSTNREFVRVALGGVRDEAEIRGHRRTYIGALPGRIIQSLKRAGKSNPVFLLDEIDKMTADFRGDPASALLEVLDPEQNKEFNDHYLDSDYDLSKVMFIATANSLHTIPQPLMDRMEIIRITGYTELEKLKICRTYLLPKQLKENGIKPENLTMTDDALYECIRRYTKEAGVRNLERVMATICRKGAMNVVQDGEDSVTAIDAKDIINFLGQPVFRYGQSETEHQVGVATGLAWTQMGGEMLVIETTVLPGKGRLQITGKLGDVMQESARAALSYVRSRSKLLGLPKYFYDKVDIHVHVPEGGIPKDGPSAGVTMTLAIVSALTGIPIDKNIAMTGEVTLRGNALPIGGFKEKALAAHRAGIKRVMLPHENENDIEEIPELIRKDLELIPVSHVDQVIFEGLMCEGPEHFAALVAEQKIRNQLLFADDYKIDVVGDSDKEEGKHETVITH